MKPFTLPPNVLRHFYAGGERIAALRGTEGGTGRGGGDPAMARAVRERYAAVARLTRAGRYTDAEAERRRGAALSSWLRMPLFSSRGTTGLRCCNACGDAGLLSARPNKAAAKHSRSTSTAAPAATRRAAG